jgi:tetratricopeptide (TPR) repeat protein
MIAECPTPSAATSFSLTDVLFRTEASQFDPSECQQARELFGAMVEGLHTDRARSPRAQVRALSQAVFGRLALRFRRQPASEAFTLCGTLLRGGGSCLGLTTLYVCASELLGWPLRAALFENHIAVAHCGSNPPLHVETTRRGAVLSEYWTAKMFGAPASPCLTSEQLLAVHLSNRAAFVLTPLGRLDDAAYLLDAAVELFPEYMAAWINLASVHIEREDFSQAAECLRQVEALNPGPKYRSMTVNLAARLREVVAVEP